ncbi:dihydrofolate reductase family protein [Millisia brevis]|uniref:dihydrofolate reductase family protein n=1 Tax=Millisia brevis TaxID=264148 RepID=UPI00082DBA8A|nr:dihydrofolate reductase family protein [Millisia brevis]
MRELVYVVAVSLDGRIAAADGDYSAFPVVGDHMDTIVTRFTDTLPGAALSALGLTPPVDRFDTVLMGAHTYDVGRAVGVDSPYPHLRQIVFDRRTDRPLGPGVERAEGSPAEVVDALKARGGAGIWLCGGGILAGALADRIDRLILKVNPILLGGDGIPLFAGALGGPAGSWKLVNSSPFESGVLINEYVRS